jgi:hypothetical protein
MSSAMTTHHEKVYRQACDDEVSTTRNHQLEMPSTSTYGTTHSRCLPLLSRQLMVQDASEAAKSQ